MIYTTNPIVNAVLSMISLGLTDFAVGVYTKKSNVWFVTVANQYIGLVLVLFYILLTKNYTFWATLSLLSNVEMLILVIIGVTNFLAITSLIKGMEKGNIGLISGVASSSGIIVAILSVVFLGEGLTLLGWLFLVCSIFGIFLASFNIKSKTHFEGLPFGLAAMLFWGVAFFLMIFISRKVDWTILTFSNFFIGSLMALGASFIAKVEMKFEKRYFWLIATVVTEIYAYYYLNKASVHPNASLIGAITNAYGAVTVILSAIILKEKLKQNQKIGLLIIISSLVGLNFFGIA